MNIGGTKPHSYGAISLAASKCTTEEIQISSQLPDVESYVRIWCINLSLLGGVSGCNTIDIGTGEIAHWTEEAAIAQ